MTRNVDYIIVGQGIAGSMVAHYLLKQHKTILVIDKFNPNSASNIAAGVVNPVTGRYMVKTWMIDDILPFAKKIYRELEQQLNASFFYEQDIYKLFSSDEVVDIWNKKKIKVEYQDYLGEIVYMEDDTVKAPFGAGIIKQCCWLDVPKFIKYFRNFLKENNNIEEEEFDITQLEMTNVIRYKNTIADKIIFCEGYSAYKNPFFKFIPFSLAKGEHFIIHSENLKTDKLISKNIFIIPKGNNLYNVGATFIWNDVSEKVTEEGRAEIQEKLSKIINTEYSIVEEKAGIRPTIKDRRPVLGCHPYLKNVYIFNGMGTKGVSIAPYFANYFVDYLHENFDISDEVAVKRFVI